MQPDLSSYNRKYVDPYGLDVGSQYYGGGANAYTSPYQYGKAGSGAGAGGGGAIGGIRAPWNPAPAGGGGGVIGVGGVPAGVPAGHLVGGAANAVYGAYAGSLETQKQLAAILAKYGISMEEWLTKMSAQQKEDILARGKAAEGEAFQRNVGYGTVGTTKLTGDVSLVKRETEAALNRFYGQDAATRIDFYRWLASSEIPMAQARLAADQSMNPKYDQYGRPRRPSFDPVYGYTGTRSR